MNNLAYFHPVAGGAVLAFLFYVGSLALRSRSRRRGAAALLAQHARLAPWMFVLVLVGWAGGLFSTWWLRHDLELGGSTHLRIGVGLVVALTGGWLTSRVMRNPTLRTAHPWFGIAAMLLGAAQVFFGLQITP